MSRPIIIAECCQNHNGSIDTLMRMVDAAVESGADYVKIQSIRSRNLTRRDRFEFGETYPDGTVKCIKRPYDEERERLEGLDLTLDEEHQFVEACKGVGVKSMTTVFDRVTVSEVAQLGFDAVKVASYDCASLPLIADLSTNFAEMFVSTGASTDSEITHTAEFLSKTDVESYFLHCVTIYPTPPKDFHLSRLAYLRMFVDNVGLSSHPNALQVGTAADKVALSLGADLIERHFTILDRSETRDGPVSIDPQGLAELRTFANLPRLERRQIVRESVPNWPTYLGRATRELSEAETLNRDYYRGRFATPVGEDHWKFNWE